MPDLVSIIVINWNGRQYLEKCLTSLFAQTYPELEIVLVDNGSTDDSVEWVTQHFPSVRLIQNSTNRGFPAASNQGVHESRGSYVAMLNNDAWAEPDWIAQMVSVLETDARLGMVASQMLFAGRPDVINSTGICVDWCGVTWDQHGGEPRHPVNQRPSPLLGPCAGAGLYRREMLDEAGVFDEEFFAYLEDVDLAWRANWLGWRGVYVPAACVYHIHSGTNIEGSPFKIYHLTQNKICVLVKNYPWPYLLFFFPLIMFYETLSFGYMLLRGQGLSALRGRLAGLRLLGRMWAKRRAIMARKRVSAREIFGLLQPARWPWQVYGQYQHVTKIAVP